jgi:hypothetical protein
MFDSSEVKVLLDYSHPAEEALTSLNPAVPCETLETNGQFWQGRDGFEDPPPPKGFYAG